MVYDDLINNINKEIVIENDSFCVVKIDNKYYKLEHDYESWNEIEIIAQLDYDVIYKPNIEIELYTLFQCDCCGECVCNDKISYFWFNIVES